MDIKLKSYEHIKTGNIYHMLDLGKVIDTTNSRDGTPVVIYYRQGQFFVRDAKEFKQKFKEVDL